MDRIKRYYWDGKDKKGGIGLNRIKREVQGWIRRKGSIGMDRIGRMVRVVLECVC